MPANRFVVKMKQKIRGELIQIICDLGNDMVSSEWSAGKLDWVQPVNNISKLNQIISGYFDPKKFCSMIII